VSRAWLILAAAPGLDGAALAPLLARFGGADGLVGAGPGAWRDAGFTEALVAHLGKPDETRIAAALEWLTGAADRHVIAFDDPRYPPLLRQIPDPPVALFVRGDPHSLQSPQLAIVGSRSASAGGAETARAFAGHLARLGLTITSGLALGIDTAAHEGALAAGGHTIAVLGTGPDQAYPRRNAPLADEIARAGALSSEFPPGMPPLRENFPRRNRIISGLAAGTLVVEAGIQSGALITARRAAEQGREVFAIPGSIHNPLAKGCHRLIREGAKLVESADHVLEELAPLLALPGSPHASANAPAVEARIGQARDPDYARLLDALGWDTIDVDTLVLRSGLTAAEVSSMLLILELEGSVQPLAGGRVQRQR
jgi:DNA processing protein